MSNLVRSAVAEVSQGCLKIHTVCSAQYLRLYLFFCGAPSNRKYCNYNPDARGIIRRVIRRGRFAALQSCARFQAARCSGSLSRIVQEVMVQEIIVQEVIWSARMSTGTPGEH